MSGLLPFYSDVKVCFMDVGLYFVPDYFENDLCGFVGDLYFVHLDLCWCRI